MSNLSKNIVLEARTGSLFVDLAAVELKAAGTASPAVATTVTVVTTTTMMDQLQVVIGAPGALFPRWLDLLRYFLPHEWRDLLELVYGDIVEMKGKACPDWVIFVAVVCDLALTFIRQRWCLVWDLVRSFFF